MKPPQGFSSTRYWLMLALIAILMSTLFLGLGKNFFTDSRLAPTSQTTQKVTQNKTSPTPSVAPEVPPRTLTRSDLAQINSLSTLDIDDPASITVVVNKRRPLQELYYEPSDLVSPTIPNVTGQLLRAEANDAMTRMYHDLKAATGYGFALCSGYRSYWHQNSTYQHWLNTLGASTAEHFSARPGYSEHQTGLAIDIVAEGEGCRYDDHLYVTVAGQWMNENAHNYGYILRYVPGLQEITGFSNEWWHWRYVGVEVATDMREKGIATLEEYFGLEPAPDYLP